MLPPAPSSPPPAAAAAFVAAAGPRRGRFGLLGDPAYRRIWLSVAISGVGNQITMIGLPLTAVLVLHASAAAVGALAAAETLPFALLALFSGVWLDRVNKLAVYIAGEIALGCAAVSVPVAAALHELSMGWLYAVAAVIGLVNTTAGSASQVVVSQVVGTEHLLEANAKNAVALSGAEIAGPGIAGVLVRAFGAPGALLANAVFLFTSAALLRGVRLRPAAVAPPGRYWDELREGLGFVARHALLPTLALHVGLFTLLYYVTNPIAIVFATKVLGLSGAGVGLSYVGVGLGTVLAGVVNGRLVQALGLGRVMTVGVAVVAVGWALIGMDGRGAFGAVVFTAALSAVSGGYFLIFLNFITVRQAVTPPALRGRMTSTMRWLILLPGVPGALIGGWLAQHAGVRAPFLLAAGCGAALTLAAGLSGRLQAVRALPTTPEG